MGIVIIIFKLNKKLLRLLWTMHDEPDQVDIFNNNKNKKEDDDYKTLANSRHSSRRGLAGVGNLGLNASVKERQLEKKLGRRMISHNTQKAKKAIYIDKTTNNEEIEIITNSSSNNLNKNKENKIKNKMSGLSTSLLQSDDDDDAQIL